MDYFEADVARSNTLTSSRREMCTSSVSNVIYHKFSHGAAFYTLNGKNVNVMLEYRFSNDVVVIRWIRSNERTYNYTLAHINNVIGNVRVNNAFSYSDNLHFEGDKIPFLRVIR